LFYKKVDIKLSSVTSATFVYHFCRVAAAAHQWHICNSSFWSTTWLKMACRSIVHTV